MQMPKIKSSGFSFALRILLALFILSAPCMTLHADALENLLQADTSLSLELSKRAMLLNGTVDAKGKLSRDPLSTAGLSGLPILLEVTAPDGSIAAHMTYTSDLLGHYELRNISGFTQKGIYKIQTSFAGTGQLNSSSSDTEKVRVMSVSGYAIIIEGKGSTVAVTPSNNKTIDRIYKSLKIRNFTDSNIFYFNYDTLQAGVDEPPTKARVQYAIQTWAKQKLNESPAPLYLIMVGPAAQNAFYIGSEMLKPSELDAWFNGLEANLNVPALAEERVIIIGACHSGSFIPMLSGSNRTIVASSAADEVSYKGSYESDSIRASELFIEELFLGLERGNSLLDAFEISTKKTEIWTRQDNTRGGLKPPYFDHSLQHPLLDDNGDGIGSNLPSKLNGDGGSASDIYLGTGAVFDPDAQGNPADIQNVTGARYVSAVSASEMIWLKASSNTLVSAAWVEIRPPSKVLQKLSLVNQAVVGNIRLPLTLSSATSLWQKQYSSFTEPGRYEIFYFVNDAETGEVSPGQRSLVYKNRSGNTPPSIFNLQYPPDGAVTPPLLQLTWGESSDSDGLTYTLLISRDPAFQTIDHIIEEVPRPSAVIGSDVKLEDYTKYYWKVSAVDSYGEVMPAGGGIIGNAAQPAEETWSFTTGSSNAMPGFISGYVTDADTGTAVASATVTSNSSGSTMTFSDGYYILAVIPGTMNMTASKTGYTSTSPVSVTVNAGESIIKSFSMSFIGTSLPTLGTVTPTPVATEQGRAQTFTAVYSDADGYANIKTAGFLVNQTLSSANAIRVLYDQAANKLKLYNDAGTAVLPTTCAPGEAGVTISNTQGTLNCEQSSVTKAGNNLTLKPNITPAAAFASPTAKKIYLRAVDKADNAADWAQKATWTILSSNTAPTLGTITPSNTSSTAGSPKTFTAVYTDADGYANLKYAELLATTAVSGGASSIWVRYDAINGKLRMFDDAGAALLNDSCSPGAAGATISNTQGTLNCEQTIVTKAGNNVTVVWSITPAIGFAGGSAKDLKMKAIDYSTATTGLVDKGDWTINAP